MVPYSHYTQQLYVCRARETTKRKTNGSNRAGEIIQPRIACVSFNKRISDHQYILKYLLKETKRTRRVTKEAIGETKKKKAHAERKKKKKKKKYRKRSCMWLTWTNVWAPMRVSIHTTQRDANKSAVRQRSRQHTFSTSARARANEDENYVPLSVLHNHQIKKKSKTKRKLVENKHVARLFFFFWFFSFFCVVFRFVGFLRMFFFLLFSSFLYFLFCLFFHFRHFLRLAIRSFHLFYYDFRHDNDPALHRHKLATRR